MSLPETTKLTMPLIEFYKLKGIEPPCEDTTTSITITLGEFNKLKQTKQKEQKKIKRQETGKKFYQKHKEHIKKRQKEYYQRNKEVCIARQKKYYELSKKGDIKYGPKDPDYWKKYNEKRKKRLGKIFCGCGGAFVPHTHSHINKHLGTKKHMKYIKTLPPPPAEWLEDL
jgi:hypothetical protein